MDDAEQYVRHMKTAHEQWKTMPEKKKQDEWLHVCAKAFVREQEKHNETKRRLDLAEQQIQLLSSHLSQNHPDSQTYPSALLPLSRETTDQLPNPDSFNYETLLSKWKTRIRSRRSIQQPLPPPSPWSNATRPPDLNGHHPTDTHYAPHQPLDQPHGHSNGAEPLSDGDEDLADAPGDEDDVEQHNGIDKDVLVYPNLREGDLDGEGQAGGRMLMGFREYAAGSGGRNGSMDMGGG